MFGAGTTQQPQSHTDPPSIRFWCIFPVAIVNDIHGRNRFSTQLINDKWFLWNPLSEAKWRWIRFAVIVADRQTFAAQR